MKKKGEMFILGNDWTGVMGDIYVLCDVVVGKMFGVCEYANDRAAVRGCNLMKLPPGLEEGDLALVKIGSRKGMEIVQCEPIVVWQNELKAVPVGVPLEVMHGKVG